MVRYVCSLFEGRYCKKKSGEAPASAPARLSSGMKRLRRKERLQWKARPGGQPEPDT